jgi:hypothetical protein
MGELQMHFRNIIRFIIVLFLFICIYIASQPAYAQTGTSAPTKSFGPVTDYDIALTSGSDSNHIRKGARYNIHGQLPELSENSELDLFDLPPSHTSKSILSSDYGTLIVGTVVAGQSYLSNDKRNIYSEFKITLQEIIKASAKSLSVGQSIDVERSGGSIRLPSGKILRRGVLAESMPQMGKRYIFLLQYKEDTDSFLLKTGYQLEGDHVYCLDDDQKNVTLNQPLKEYGTNESQLIERMKKSVSAEKGDN